MFKTSVPFTRKTSNASGECKMALMAGESVVKNKPNGSLSFNRTSLIVGKTFQEEPQRASRPVSAFIIASPGQLTLCSSF